MTELPGHPINSVFNQYWPLVYSVLNYKNILQYHFKVISPSHNFRNTQRLEIWPIDE